MSFDDSLEARVRVVLDEAGQDGVGIGWGRRLDTVPFVTLQIISDPRPQHYKGLQRVRASDVQIDTWATKPGDAAILRDILIAGLIVAERTRDGIQYQRAMITNVRGGSEQQSPQQGTTQRFRGELFRQSIDITLTHNA